jgi:hypothetical protein
LYVHGDGVVDDNRRGGLTQLLEQITRKMQQDEHMYIYHGGIAYRITCIHGGMYFNVSRRLPNGKTEKSTIICPPPYQAGLSLQCHE